MNVEEAIQKIKSRNLNYWEEAEICRDICNTGITQDALSRLVGLRQCTISNKLRILKLPAEVQMVIKNKGLQERYARALLKFRDKSRQLEIIEHVCKHNLKVLDAEDYINRLLHASHDLGNVKEFASIISQGIKSLKANGINVASKKVKRENCTDLIIRFYK